MKNVLRIGIVFLFTVVLCLCFGAVAFAEDTTFVLTDEAVYDADVYTLTLDANGGYFYNDKSFKIENYDVTDGDSFYGEDLTPTNPDPRMAFSGWYYDAACTELAISRYDNYTPADDVTLYAGWTAGWIVTFDANGGNFGGDVTTHSYTVPKGSGIKYYVSSVSAEHNMWFGYWTLADGTRVDVWDYIPEEDITLYAQYVHFHRVTLDANGGYFYNDKTFTIENYRVTDGDSIYGEDLTPTNPDSRMAFNGWYYDAACTELAISRYDSYTPTEDVTLYAGWTEGWIVTFDANGGNFGGDVTTLNYTVPKGSAIRYNPRPVSAESNMQFSYWALEDGTRVNSGGYIPEGDVTLFAQYAHFYLVTCNANGGYYNNNPSNTIRRIGVTEGNSFYGGNSLPTNPDPRMAFTGWYYDVACTELAVGRYDSYTPTEDVTLYAGWTEGWIVTFDANGGEGAPATKTKSQGETMQLSWDSPNREGFYFLGWAETPDADRAAYLPGESFTEDADTTLYALWGNPDFVLPESVTQIGEEAFADAAVRFVKLPDSTASVGPRAFAGCTELRYIVIPDYLNQIDFSAFEGTEDVIVLTFSQFGRLYRLPDYMRMMAP